VASSRAVPAQHSVPKLSIASKNIIFFILRPHFFGPWHINKSGLTCLINNAHSKLIGAHLTRR
jgi:hypothetical protein